MTPTPLSLLQVFEHLLQCTAEELAQAAVLSVELAGANAEEASKVIFVPLTHIEQLTAPLHDTPEGLCPASELPELMARAPIAYRAGQLFFTHILPDYVNPACLPDSK